MADLPFAMKAPVPPTFPDRVFSIADHGAVPDGVTLNTRAFAAAIAACAKAGGGHVVVPPGVWRTGPIELESGVDLHLDRGALVAFSRRFEDFPVVPRYPGAREHRVMSPITAHGKKGFAITGKGVFDGSGDAWAYAKKDKLAPSEWRRLVARGGATTPDGSQWWPSREAMEGAALVAALREREDATAADWARAREYLRPDMVSISDSRDILIDGPTFRNSPHFTIHPVEVENLIIRDVAVRNPWNTQNADGIDIGPCRNVVVYDTLVDTGDDGICMKPGRPTVRTEWTVASENVVIADSTVFRAHGGFVIGSETSGGMRHVMVRNVTFVETDIGLRFKSARGRGGVIEKVHVRDVALKDIATGAVVFQTSYGGAAPAEEPEGGAARPAAAAAAPPAPAARIPLFQDFVIENLACDGAREAMTIEGLPEAPIRRIVFRNVTISAQKGARLVETEGIRMKDVRILPASGEALIQSQTRDLVVE
jgi:polygalacturonase